MMKNRRREMIILEGIPSEILDKVESPEKWNDIPNVMMERNEMDYEALDLYQEKLYLIASIEYLKERLNKVQTNKL